MKRTQQGGFEKVQSAFSFIATQVENHNKKLITKRQYRQAIQKRLMSAVMMTAIAVATTMPYMKTEAEELTPQPEPTFDTTLRLDKESATLLAIDDAKVEIKPGKSNAALEAERKAAEAAAHARLAAASQTAQTNRSVIASVSATVKAGSLSAEEAHRMAKEAAAKAGIPDQWKILAAVWQKETGKSGDSCIVSGADGRATGPMQFMPSTFRAHASHPDANICKATDALEAAANLLRDSGLAHGDVNSALLSYNHSGAYVSSVKQIANSIN